MNDQKLAELIPHLKCIRCGSKEDLHPFKQKRIADFQPDIKKLYASYKTYSTLFPVCKSCYHGFNSIMSSRKKDILYLFLSIIVFITLCMGGFFVVTQFSDVGILVLTAHIFLFIVCVVITRKSFRHSKNDTMNPAKYFNITNLGQVFVKPLGAAKTLPYEVWLETVLKDNFY